MAKRNAELISAEPLLKSTCEKKRKMSLLSLSFSFFLLSFGSILLVLSAVLGGFFARYFLYETR